MTAGKETKPLILPAIVGDIWKFILRPATENDFAFCETLYLSSMKPLLKMLNAWNEGNVIASFKDYFKTEEIRIIVVDGNDAGWIQVSEVSNAVNIDQIHLLEEYRGHGLGAQLIGDTMTYAAKKGKPVLLSLVRGNPAVRLYHHLGFKSDGKDSTKEHMRWECDWAVKTS